MKIAFVGGGAVATAIAGLAKAAGHDVVLGVRDSAAARAFPHTGMEAAVASADIVIVAIPYASIAEVLPSLADALAGKIVVDASNPVAADWSPILTGETSSGAEQMQALLPRSFVAKAFNTIFADVLRPDRLDRKGSPISLFVAGDDAEATRLVMAFGAEIGLDPVNAGPLKSARYLEAIAHLNIELAIGQAGGTSAAILYDPAV
jgi:predicted dinucleotide-binding enzyme